MRYAIEHAEGHVQILCVVPKCLRDADGNVAFKFVYHNGNKAVFASPDGHHLLTHITEVPMWLWRPDTVPDFTIEFQDPAELAKTLPTEFRDEATGKVLFSFAPTIVAIHEVTAAPAEPRQPPDPLRNAWRAPGGDGRVRVDMPKARELWRECMRRARAPLLARLDVEYQRADEVGDAAAKQAVAGRKKVLRDVTADVAIEMADNPEALKQCWPAYLGDRPGARLTLRRAVD
jgi:hypothetical protein